MDGDAIFTAQEVRWAVLECVRQQVGPIEVENLLLALDCAKTLKETRKLPSLSDIKTIAGIIEPKKAENYRTTPVVFNQGEPALKAEHIERQMKLLFNSINEMPIDDFVMRFLVIHPYVDGNGRTASILYNWLIDTLEHPIPLPYYFGKEHNEKK